MDKKAQREAARQVGRDVLAELRQKTYAQLSKEFVDPRVRDVTSQGRSYQVEIESFWDDPRQKGGNLRVMAAVTDEAWSGFFAVTESFIISPHGRFIGE